MRVFSFSKKPLIFLVQRSVLIKNLDSKNIKQTANFVTNKRKNKTNFAKYLGAFLLGSGTYFLIKKYLENKRPTILDDDQTLDIDLNEIYEKTAVVFLSNPELREALGMPIKITSSDEFDQIRSINLR